MESGKQWYVIHTYSGYENKVKTNLERRIESMSMEERVFRIFVPTEEQLDFKDGKKRVIERKIFPGYVLVEMIMTDESWYVVRNTPGVTGFVGSGNRPVPLKDEEVETILKQVGMGQKQRKVAFEVGQKVKVVDGPFINFSGRVEDVNLEKGKLRVSVSMFGRDTPVELNFEQVQKF